MFSVRNNKKIECVLFCYCCCFLPGFALLLCSTQPFLILTTLIYQIRLQHLPFGTPPSSVFTAFYFHFTSHVYLRGLIVKKPPLKQITVQQRSFYLALLILLLWSDISRCTVWVFNCIWMHFIARARESESSCSSFKMIKNLQLLQQYCNPGIFFSCHFWNFAALSSERSELYTRFARTFRTIFWVWHHLICYALLYKWVYIWHHIIRCDW